MGLNPRRANPIPCPIIVASPKVTSIGCRPNNRSKLCFRISLPASIGASAEYSAHRSPFTVHRSPNCYSCVKHHSLTINFRNNIIYLHNVKAIITICFINYDRYRCTVDQDYSKTKRRIFGRKMFWYSSFTGERNFMRLRWGRRM